MNNDSSVNLVDSLNNKLIQSCTSRFKICKCYTKSLPGSSGNIVVNNLTLAMRVSNLIRQQSSNRNAQWTQKHISLNVYGQRAGGPTGYGQSPKNIF